MSSPTTETSPKENSQKIGSGYSLRDKRKVTRRDDEFEYENPRSRITPLRKRKSFGDRKPPSGRRRPRNTQRLQSTTKTNPVKTALVEQHKKPEKHPNAKKINHGWFLDDCHKNYKLVYPNDSAYKLIDPGELERINEKQEWAESYIICPGQDTLCRWM